MTNRTNVQAELSTWQLDPAHSSIEFAVKHMMMTTVRGRFKRVEAEIRGSEDDPHDAHVRVDIDPASIDTGAPDRDQHLRSADFFDAERHPKITFRGKRIEGDAREAGDAFTLVGDLTIRDTTMEVVLDCRFEGRGIDPWGKERVGFRATGELDRREWGLRWNQAIETGGVLVANKVRIEAQAQFVRQED